MPRNLSKRHPLTAGSLVLTGLLGVLLSGSVQGQSKTPPALQKGSPATTTTSTQVLSPEDDQRRAAIWAATARFVYADDPALAKIRTQLEQTIDDGSLRTFARSLDDAVGIEKAAAPTQKHVLKLQGIFKEVQAQQPADLPTLVQAIRQRLETNTERMNDPARRQKLNTLLTQLNQLAVPTAAAVAVELENQPETSAANTDPGAAALAQAAAADTQPLTSNEPSVANTPANPPAPPVVAASAMSILPLLLSALSLLGVLYLFLTRSRAPEAAYRVEPEPSLANRKPFEPSLSIAQYQEIQKEVRKLVQTEVANALAANRPAAPAASPPTQPNQGNQKKGAPRPATVPQPPQPARPAATAAPAPTAAAPAQQPPSLSELAFAEPVPAPAPPAPRHRTIYVNQQPLDGAFRRDNLADAPASYTIFEITVDEQQDPNLGTFVVTRNEGSHGGYIGSHHSILDPACVYSYPQGAVSRIITDTPGTVQKTPSGDWHITQKARIHFA